MTPLIASSLVFLLAAADMPLAGIEAAAAGYAGPVEQAFDSHCADCHGQLPASLAGAARATAEKKRKRAHRKFGMDEGFPFTGKWPLPKVLAEIRDEVADEDMPPASYMKKKGVAISAAERQAILDWARSTEAALQPGVAP